MIVYETKNTICNAWFNRSRFTFGAEWNFIKGYWDITFEFAFWAISFSKLIHLPKPSQKTKKGKKK